jgi:ankyrin repeat protein
VFSTPKENLMKYFKILLLSVVLFGISSVRAGSYEDFFVAVRNDDGPAISALLQRGFDPNSRDPSGQPGLTLAARDQAWRALEALLAHPGVDVNALNASGESALMMAALRGQLRGCRRLVERGAEIRQPGWSAIHYAATGPSAQVVEFLLDQGADPNASSPNGSTPLMMAARYGSEESVNLLLLRGADTTRKNERRLEAADFARLGGREALAARLARR